MAILSVDVQAESPVPCDSLSGPAALYHAGSDAVALPILR
jgi:hypothetical protein